MKGNPKLIEALNHLLSDELTAINQYMVHAEMCENWGYQGLYKYTEKRAIDEMKHAEELIARILFLEGQPIVSSLGKITIGEDVPKMLANDLKLEMGGIKNYNDTIKLALEVGDNATKEIVEGILKAEDGHVDGIEAYQDQIQQMGLQLFLSTQTGE